MKLSDMSLHALIALHLRVNRRRVGRWRMRARDISHEIDKRLAVRVLSRQTHMENKITNDIARALTHEKFERLDREIDSDGDPVYMIMDVRGDEYCSDDLAVACGMFLWQHGS